MKRKTLRDIALRSFVLVVVASAAWQAQARDSKTPYPSMAPLDQYLMDRDAEIVLARSAAPESISRDAEVMVLGRHGYETVAKGKNGFVCMVERSWMAGIDDTDFWNPRLRGPICLNPAAVRSYLPRTIKKTELILATQSKAQMFADIKVALDKKELPMPEPGDVLHDVQTGVLERQCRALASPPDVFRSTNGPCSLGRRLAGLAGFSIQGHGGNDHISGSHRQVVGRYDCPSGGALSTALSRRLTETNPAATVQRMRGMLPSPNRG